MSLSNALSRSQGFQREMPELKDLAGRYVGRLQVRKGKEDSLAPSERKRFLKATEEITLEILPDGAFVHRTTTAGACEIRGSVVHFHPVSFSGKTLAEMQRAAEEDGRSFGLAWLFDPFELRIIEGKLTSTDDRSVFVTEYVKR